MTHTYDKACLACQTERRQTPHPLKERAEKRLHERLADLKEKCAYKMSCFDLQTSNDLLADLQDIYESMQKNSHFLGVLAGGASLHELKHCLTKAESELYDHAYPHVAPMLDLGELSSHLHKAGFCDTAGDIERFTLIYPDIVTLMHDLRRCGFSNSLAARSRHVSRRALFARAHELYQELFPAPDQTGITATIELLYMHGWKSEDR
jgi:hypothetical protein